MKSLLPLLLVAAALVGCGDSGGGTDIKPAAPLNPSGKPRNAEEAATATAQQKAGEQMNAEMTEAARKAAEAKAQSGGK